MTRTSAQRYQKARRIVQKSRSTEFKVGRWTLTFEYGDLLSEGEDFHGRIGSTPEEDTYRGEKGKDGFEHELTLNMP